MVEACIEADVVYQHDQLGEVLVTGIAKMYDEWDVSNANGLDGGEPSSASESEVLVFYYDNFDGYGGMNPMLLSDPIGEFAKSVSRDRLFEYDSVSDLRED